MLETTLLEIPDLEAHLSRLLDQIPVGKVTSYGVLARALGDVTAARWVGLFLLHHDHTPACPCHRVVRAGGEVGRYIAGASSHKAARLRREGARFCGDKLDLARCGFDTFETEAPLAALRRAQRRLLGRLSLENLVQGLPPCVAGVDTSYARSGEAVALYALVEGRTGRCVWHASARRMARFPYIPGYLAFREFPLLLELLERVAGQGRLAPVLFVDGTGILHPRQAGLASHVGVLAGIPTVGVTKKLLCGQVHLEGQGVGEGRTVVHDGQALGVAYKSKQGVKPVYLSPGHGVSLASLLAVAAPWFLGHKLPQPLYWADRLSREAARR